MRQKKYIMEQALAWFMRITTTMMILVFLGIGMKRIKFQINKQQAARWVLSVWQFSYPGTAVSESDPDQWSVAFWLEKFWCLDPVYRFETRQHPPEERIKFEDPAYASYRTQQFFYQEHEYLFKYGAEDTNASEYPVTEEVPELLADATKTTPAHIVSEQFPVLGAQYVKEQLADYDFLMKHFYNVHTSTTADRKLMSAETFLNKDFSLTAAVGQPQILIYHTHSQEAYADYDSQHPERTVVGIGTYLTELLEAKGYSVIHDQSVYDLKNGKLDRNHAYNYALEGITEILQNNPSIEVVLDLHRDGVKESLHMVSEVNGKQTAPIMFFNGMSQTPEGPIEYLQNPYREDNLAFSFQMQLNAAAYFPGLTRKIYLKGLRYNQHLRPKSALIEVGAQTNTYQEAYHAMEPLAELLDMVLQGN